MSSMNITKSKFMEYIRCNRYPALNNIHKRKKMDEAFFKLGQVIKPLKGLPLHFQIND